MIDFDFERYIRPAQFATLLLGSGESLPRARARDQQADLAGSRLKQQVLRRVIELDPEPTDFHVILDAIIAEIGEPTGPTRAMARLIVEEWISTNPHPSLTEWLLQQAVQSNSKPRQ